MTSAPIVKHRPDDFIVRESMVVDLTTRSAATYQYLLLRKCGYTTPDACDVVASALGIGAQDVTYGGRKDEDGISEQLVCVPRGALRHPQGEDQLVVAEGPQWIQVQHYGYGVNPLRIGLLEGNGFQIIVRNLSSDYARRFREGERLAMLFLNYYDIQRFGVPDGPKHTHRVGAALLAGHWDEALTVLAELKSSESEAATRWLGDARAFFGQLDPRSVSFFLAAHASHAWNDTLARLTRERFPDATPVEIEGIKFWYLPSPQAAAALLGAGLTLPYTRYAVAEEGFTASESQRASVVHTNVRVSGLTEDEHFPGRSRMTIRLFLPSGSYATAAIRQLLSYRTLNGA